MGSTSYARYSGIVGAATGVTSLNGEVGAVTLVAGTGISVSPSGQNITITATGAELVFGDLTSSSPSNLTVGNGAGSVKGTGTTLTLTGASLVESTSSVLTIGNGANCLIGTGTTLTVKQASTSQSGYLSATDWNTFNGKQALLTIGNLTDVGTDGIVVTNGSGAVIGSGTSIAQHVADTTHNGYLSSADWNTFNGKGSGTVTSISVASSNGFAGSSSGGATPSLTLTTSITGVLKGNGTAISAATSGTDYSGGTSALGTGILKSTTSTGALTIATAADFPTLNQNTSGNAATVTTNANMTGDVTSVGNVTTAAATQANIATLSKSAGVAVHGTNTNDSASAGYLGEFASVNSPTGGTATPGATGVYVNVASMSLTAGDWDVWGELNISFGGTHVGTDIVAGISKNTGALDSASQGGLIKLYGNNVANGSPYISIGIRRISLVSTATVYLVVAMDYATLGSTTYASDSAILARRAR